MGDARPETRGYNQLSRPISDSNSPCDDDDNTPTGKRLVTSHTCTRDHTPSYGR